MLLAAACTDRAQEPEVAALQAALESSADAGGGDLPLAPECVPQDTVDATCDDVDDDCDGQVDEDCDFDPANCPPDAVLLEGTPGDDWLIGSSKRDCILGYGGNDRIWGLQDDDVLVGGPGDDKLLGFAGNDTMLGSAGADELSGGAGEDSIEGGRGNDFIEGGSGDDSVHGGDCHDLIVDASGADLLYGDAGSDRIVGSEETRLREGGDGFDACDGDCEQPERADMCQADADCAAGLRCVAGSGICVAPHEVAFSDVICDGADDDCDGHVDEEFESTATACGTGECAATGTTACTNGAVVDSCTPGTPAESDLTCDGLDDDCDRNTDENFSGEQTSCGVGACAANGATSCVEGAVVDNCAPGTPAESDATCDDTDDDCDGNADEHYASAATSCGVGACAANGATSCVQGTVVDSCTPGTPAPSDATCDGVDDDCDGTADEHYVSQATSCGVGACAATGVLACVAGAVVDSCLPGTPAESDATCDGSDDDCDGTADEDYVSQATSCGVGACAATGVTACTGGVVSDSCTPGLPAGSDPSCDAVDDDCDAFVDEDYAPVETTCEVSGCLAEGETECVAGQVQDTCLSEPICISELVCDDADDNDDDGLADCDDPDCAEAPLCQVQEFELTVVANANIWGAGHPSAPAEGVVPPGVMLELDGGSVLTLPSVTGTIIYGSGDIGPDGIAGPWSVPDLSGIAGYSHTTRMIQLAAVFLGPDEPADPAPPRLSFEHSEFTELAPAIEQIFVVGDGRTSGGELQSFIVPDGATRVFIGITDMCGSSVGCYGDNFGSYQVQGELRY